MENVLLNQKLKLNTRKIDITNIIIYFVFYSFIGFCLESIFGVFSKGVLESRQSFLFGPFCAIYGIGAILMIYFLTPYKNHSLIIIIGSCIIGTTCEYLMSYFCEQFLHFKWWDYSSYILNINGRTCLYFSSLWAILGFTLIKFINPSFDKLIFNLKSKINPKAYTIVVYGALLFIVIDIFISTLALESLYISISSDYNLPYSPFIKTYISKLSDIELFSKEKLIKIYPNLRIAGTRINNTFVDSLYNFDKTYYIKIFDK